VASNLVGIRMAVDAACQREAISQRGAKLNATAGLVRQAATASAILAKR